MPSVCDDRRSGIGMPSMTYSALLLPLIDFTPRITTRVEPPVPEALALICSPAILPASELTKLASLTVLTTSPPTSWTLYVSDFSSFLMPRAVTTTASSISFSSFRTICRGCPVTGISSVW